MTNVITAYFKDESAAAAIEYSLVIALVSVALIAAMVQVGVKFNDMTSMVTKTISAVLNRINGVN